MNLILLFLCAFIFGFGSNFADLLDEHGLQWFRGSPVFCGIVWSIAGVGMIMLYPPMGSYLVGLILFWLVRNKLDFINHQISAAIMLVAAFWQMGKGELNIQYALLCFLLFLMLSMMAKHWKKKFGNSAILQWKDVIAVAVLSFLFHSILPTVTHLFIISGVFISTKWFEWFEKQMRPTSFHALGLSMKRVA